MKTFRWGWLQLMQLFIFVLITGVASAQLHADFSAKPITGCPPMVVSFQDSSTGNPTAWQWDLGNGTISFLQNPIGTYFNPGTYTVKLIVKNATGSDTIIKDKIIVVNALPTAKFGASDTTGCFPLKVQFKDSSLAGSGNIASWQWDFGDGTLSSQQNPLHVYTNLGTYAVTLRVVNSNGCSMVMNKPNYIKLTDGVKADFTSFFQPGCKTPTAVTFTNLSTGTGTLAYSWSFGDGQTSNQTNPVNSYSTSGSYTVRLIAKSSYGCTDTISKTNAVTINPVKTDFTAPDSICAGSSVFLTNTSTPAPISAMWNFGDATSATSINATKSYTTPGTYQIKLLNNFGPCVDSVSKPIKVLAKPAVSFTASNNTSCSFPLVVSFTNTSTGGVSYKWDFGDNTTSTAQSPSHTYTQAGSFNVTLIVTNAIGCTDTLTKTGLVSILPPSILRIDNASAIGCIPYTITPNAILQNAAGVTYSWDFGDGSTSAIANPSHTYTTPGIYSVKLVIKTSSGCGDSSVVANSVKVGTKPVANFVGNPLDVCPTIPVNFSDLSTNGPIHDWLWDFGDGSTSNEQNPKHLYADSGYYTVSLIVYNYGCSDTLTKVKYVHVKPPIARFDTAFLCNDPFKRNFIDHSKGAETWTWDFGDGNTSTAQNPSYTYAAPGTYKVTLKVTNGSCYHELKKDVVVIKEKGNITTSDSVFCLNTRVTYNVENINANNIQSYTWFFDGIPGDQIVTNTIPVAISFQTTGTRPTVAILTDNLGCKDTISANIAIHIYGLKAGFKSDYTGTCFGNTINFTDTSKTDGIHAITNWTWNFGEGTPQAYTAGPFKHNYTDTGTYNVQMVITDSYGCKDSAYQPAFISITKPVAKFTPSDTLLCPNSSVTLTNTSTGNGLSYFWDFGDGTTSTTTSPVHTFTANGSYKVSLVITDKNGCGDSSSVVIKSYQAVAGFVMSDSFSTCPPLVVNFTNTSTYFANYSWDFGDGNGSSQITDPSHIYTQPGIFYPKLIVTNNGGCTDSLTRRVEIKGPSGVFSYNPLTACNPAKIDFIANTKNTINYIWDFSDGNTIFTITPTASHSYKRTGGYLPKLILEDGMGCKVAIVGLDTIKVKDIETYIVAQNKVLCDSGFVAFSDSTISNDVVTGYSWNFGDGTTSTQRAPLHSFKDTGLYTITLVSNTKFGCSDTTVSPNYIKIVRSPKIKMFGDSAGCEPANISLQAATVRADTSTVNWSWNFGNGQISNVQNPASQPYINAGNYIVTLLATNSSGCIDTTSRSINIHPKPSVDAGIDTTICKFSSYTLNATGADKYTWSNNPSLSCFACASPSIKGDTLDKYFVTGETIYGCTNVDSIVVKVKQPFKMAVNTNDTLCFGSSKNLKASGADLYDWNPSLWLSTPTIANPTTRPDSSITYRVIGRDDHSCFADTGYVNIKVYPIPVIDITNGTSISLQVGSSVKLSTKSSSDITTWKWTPTLGLSCVTCAEPVAAPKDKITYSVVGSNIGNCTAKDDITISLICNNANIYIPNTFSPNNDGMNDVFYARGSGLFTIRSFKVFNRWGQLVFSKDNCSPNNPAFGWDGTVNGAKATPDVFVYMMEVVCENNTIIPLKGNVSLIN